MIAFLPRAPAAPGAERRLMGQPVVHFEIVGQDGEKLQSYYSELFGWSIDANNPMKYGIVAREDNVNSDGVGIGGGVATGPEGYPGHVTFYVEVPDAEAALAKAESLGGTRVMGPDEVMEGLVIGLFNDPEGHVIGVIQSAS
jgi:predicted enzyme related to lactoylglutathione lyase